MIRFDGDSVHLGSPRAQGMKRTLWCIAFLLAISIPLRAGSTDDFSPLFAGPSLEHSIGDRDYWSIEDGVLSAKTDSHNTESEFLLRQERFGNFIFRFLVRSDGASLGVLFRAVILPPGQLVAFTTTVGGERSGGLRFRKPMSQFPSAAKQEAGHAAPGFPDAIAMPFLRQSEEVELIDSHSTNSGTFPRNRWVPCEIDGLGDHILVKINGTITARYRVDSSFYEKVLGIHPRAETIGKSGPFYEGMIGLQLPPATTGKIELKDIEIKPLGDVQWPEQGSSDQTGSAESWKASAPPFRRTSDSEWSQETSDLLAIANSDQGFHPIFDGKTLQGWRDSASFWAAQPGAIVGQARNVFLVTDREYSDFILKGSVHLMPPGGNSGVQVRSEIISDGMKGYQFDMGIPWWGQLYVESSMRGILAPVDDRMKRVNIVSPNDWNDFVIVCKGDHLIGKLNGNVTYDFVDYYDDTTGLIGLQIHAGAPMTVEFKNLEIRELH
jgi:hypothetical protein